MTEDIRRVRMLKQFEEEFLPDYDAANMPSADKRSAYALEHIAFRLARIDKKFDQLITIFEALVSGDRR